MAAFPQPDRGEAIASRPDRSSQPSNMIGLDAVNVKSAGSGGLVPMGRVIGNG